MYTSTEFDVNAIALSICTLLASNNVLSKNTCCFVVISLPMLTVSADIIGVVGGAIVTVFVLHSDPMHYFDRAIAVISVGDFIGSLIKSTIFGAEVIIISCFYGFRTSGGAEGVGKATTTSVVYSFMIILITDYVLVSILGLFGM